MGSLSSLWGSIGDAGSSVAEGISDAGSSVWEGVEDAGMEFKTLYKDEFLDKIWSVTDDSLDSLEDLTQDDGYRQAATAALSYWAGGGEGFDGTNSLDTYFGAENAETGRNIADVFSNVGGSSSSSSSDQQEQPYSYGTSPARASQRSDTYSGLMKRLTSLLSQNTTDPYEEIVLPSG